MIVEALKSHLLLGFGKTLHNRPPIHMPGEINEQFTNKRLGTTSEELVFNLFEAWRSLFQPRLSTMHNWKLGKQMETFCWARCFYIIAYVVVLVGES